MSARAKYAAVVLALPVVLLAAASASAQSQVKVVPDESARRVDITVDGNPFTSYIWPTALKKPVLYPIRTGTGTLVTRGYPLEPREGERVDHPHHVGLWFNHGDVNGLDFWNNSDAIPADRKDKMGTIVHSKIVDAKSGAGQGELTVESEWQKPDGSTLLKERTRYVFRADGTSRSIDRITTLTALGERVVFNDNKEGVIGMRVARALEQPATQPDVFTDASGKPSATKVLDNTGVTGEYTSSEGLKGDAVWGTRGRWTMLAGTVESEPVTLVMLDHPANPGFPTYWHARGYGLFAANPMGEKVFTEGKEELNVTIQPGESIEFRHRILILSSQATTDAVERQYRAFTGS
jgi:Methane oxygenase PmoA